MLSGERKASNRSSPRGPMKRPAFAAFAFALRRAADPGQATAADIEKSLPLLDPKPRATDRRLAPTRRRAAFATPSAYEGHRDRVLGLAPVVARAYRQWIRGERLLRDFASAQALSLRLGTFPRAQKGASRARLHRYPRARRPISWRNEASSRRADFVSRPATITS